MRCMTHSTTTRTFIMRNLFTVVCLLFPIIAYAQTRTITGTVCESSTEEPMAGCTVYLKGTSTGTVTNEDGRFTLSVPADNNRALCVSYIGYETVTVVLNPRYTTYNIRLGDSRRTGYQLIQRTNQYKASNLSNTTKNIRGRLLHNYNYDDGVIRPLRNRKIKVLSHGITVKTDKNGYFTLHAVTEADQLEDVKSRETFFVAEVLDSAWNVYPDPVFPHTTTNKKDTIGVLYLTNDMPGSNHSRYVDRIKSIRKIGKQRYIVKGAFEKATLTGHKASFSSYIDIGTVGKFPDMPNDFFRTGVSFGNHLTVKAGGPGLNIFTIALGQNRNNMTFPNAYKDTYNASFNIKSTHSPTWRSEAGILYKSTYAKLTQQGANLSSILHEVFVDPTTYNRHTITDYYPDRYKDDNMIAFLKTTKEFGRVTTSATVGYDKLWNKRHDGMPGILFVPYQYAYRNMQLSNLTGKADLNWRIKQHDTKINGYASYGFKRAEEKIKRDDISRPTLEWSHPYYLELRNKLGRTAHNIRYGVDISPPGYMLLMEVYNSHYFSNTINSSDYVNLFPELNFSWNMRDFIDRVFYGYNQNLVLYGSISRSMEESRLIYRNPTILSTRWYFGDVRSYREYAEMFNHKDLKPETYLRSEIGLRYFSPNDKFSGNAHIFHYNTHNYIAPIVENVQTPILNNIGRVRYYGYYASGTFHKRQFDNRLGFDITLAFTRKKSKVSAVYGGREYVPLAGFRNVQTVFAKDQPLGVIYGTVYSRDANGQYVLDYNGDPVVDSALKKIGDPTPDFVIDLNPIFRWKEFTLSFAMEYSHGGDRWNGTQVEINYMKKIKAGEYDNIVYVGEDYIRDASFFRLSNAMLSYSILKNEEARFMKSIRVSVQGRNLFVISPYKGVDPSSLFFGDSAGYGLDLFNLPSTRSYTLSITLGF